MASRLDTVVESLVRDRREAARLVQQTGLKSTQALLQRAQKDLVQRLARAEGLGGPGTDSFTAAQLRATLDRVKLVTRNLAQAMEAETLKGGAEAARQGASLAARELVDADRAFRGVGGAPLALDEARMLDVAAQGVRASQLRRIALSGTRAARGTETERSHMGKPGVLRRYGVETIAHFERILQTALVTKKSLRDVRNDLVAASPFLQGAPAHWAQRIARTEYMGALNRGAWEASREAHQQLGDVVKVLCATFDDRTASDSYAVHGQIRRPEEPFEWWDGAYQHPPNRPNDREVVLTYRVSWPIGDALKWMPDLAVKAAWTREKRRGAPPERPLMTTVPLADFGR